MQPMTELDAVSLRDYYRRFAELEAAGTSPIYSEWARGVAADDEILTRLLTLPRVKRQANLLFAAARHLGAGEGDFAGLRTWLLANWGACAEVMLTHATQTNEAGRCAVLLPQLAAIDGPVALIEVGASAGLCLYPDRCSYRYLTEAGTVDLDPVDGPSPVRIEARLAGTPAPDRLPEIVWRAGIDLNPLDVRDAGTRSWLRSLIWPEHDERRARLDAAADIVAADPPHLVAGDLLEQVESLIAEAPAGSTVVVFHSAVLVYVDPDERARFAELMRGLTRERADRRAGGQARIVWLSNEGRDVFPEIGAQVNGPTDGKFVLAVNGRAVALTGPHGQSSRSL